MDLLSPDNELDLSDPYLEDLHRRCNRTSAVYWHRGQDPECLHNPGCVIEGEVTNSVVFTGAKGETRCKGN